MTIRRRTILVAGATAGTALASGAPGVATAAAAAGTAGTAEITVVAVGRAGGGAAKAFLELVRTDRPAEPIGMPFEGTMRVPVERGTYLVSVEVQEDRVRTWLVQPGIRVDGPVTVTADARAGRPVAIAVPRQDAVPELLEVRYRMPVSGGETWENRCAGTCVACTSGRWAGSGRSTGSGSWSRSP
ncbi:hypothetical protein AB0J72_14505 [Dactylosporangium sp. NPDC049742]|uniref:hypothetical protein n=1 Tax=Dactylosporangium sp. NPDC049742 TaxID=3154737 RepID=UPI003421F12B